MSQMFQLGLHLQMVAILMFVMLHVVVTFARRTFWTDMDAFMHFAHMLKRLQLLSAALLVCGMLMCWGGL